MGKDFKVKVFDGTERAETFMEVFGRTEVCVLSPIPVLVGVEGFDEPQVAYMLDLNEITHEERQRLVNHISDKFNLNPAFVDNQIFERGVPIMAGECTLTIENPQKWIDLVDLGHDDDDNDSDDDYEFEWD